jgi:hypothetical protein
MSWPAGRGRRQWISVGLLGAVLLSWAWIAVWVIWLALAILYWALRGIWWILCRPAAIWKAHAQENGAPAAF